MDLNGPFGTYTKTPESTVLPWLTAQFADGPSGSVIVTLTASHLTGGEFVDGLRDGIGNDGWYLNLDPRLDPTLLTFSSPVKTGSFGDPMVNKGADAYKADGDGYYDILVSFPAGNVGDDRFGPAESCQFTVTYGGTGSLTPSSFDYLSTSKKGQDKQDGYLSAAHVQGIYVGPTPADTTSCWIAPVPEPSTWVLAVLGTAGMTLYYRRRS
jgi:hypothetical protein